MVDRGFGVPSRLQNRSASRSRTGLFILSSYQFQKLVYADAQIIWGVFLGFPSGSNIQVSKDKLPFVEFNDLVRQNGNIQHQNAVIEIDCFYSSYTIIKFKEEAMSRKFRFSFTEAIDLEEFK